MMQTYAMSGNTWLFLAVLMPMVGAFVSYLIGCFNKKARDLFADGIVLLEFALLMGLVISGASFAHEVTYKEPHFLIENFCGMNLHLMMDGFRALYGTIAAFMWLMTTVFSRQYFGHYRNRNRYYFFLLLTLGATVGVFLSADLYTTFIFFEIMSFTSYVWVLHEEKPAAMRAAETYLAVAVIGGMVMLMGLFLLHHTLGTLEISELLSRSRSVWQTEKKTLYIAGGLMVFGFGAKAGMFPLHIWLPKAHPVAPAPASALLSGILTKSGVFGILVVTCNLFLHDAPWGMVILLLGVVTMFGGAMLAVFSVDFKRTLACSSMSQIGFILVGVGMQCLLGEENALAVRGTVLHMVNHSLIKLDLFMVAGVIFMNLHKLNLNEIRGFGKKKPMLMACYLMGALGIGGIPLWNGYVSKTLLHESIVEYTELLEHAAHGASEGMHLLGTPAMFTAIEWIFLISGGMTIAYMLKLFVAVFVESNKDADVQRSFDEKKNYWNLESKIAICGSALVLPIMGFFPFATMDKMADLSQSFMHLEEAHLVHYFTFGNIKGALISIAIGGALYFGVIRTLLMKDGEYVDRWPKWLDLENLIYRPILQRFLPWFMGDIVCKVIDFENRVFKPFFTKFIPWFFGGVLGRAFDQMLDGGILLARKTTHRQMMMEDKERVKDQMAIRLGTFLDKITGLSGERSYVTKLVELEEETKQTTRIIIGGISFALLLVVVGLILVLGYMLLS